MINISKDFPRFVVFEGVDGSGKTTLAKALVRYYTAIAPGVPLYANSFPGSTPGTLGEWVYRLHHDSVEQGLHRTSIAFPALQFLHVAAHIDAIITHILPTLANGGLVILDRYWWSTYSYTREVLPPTMIWPLVNAERVFLNQTIQPTIIYLSRKQSLKGKEISPIRHMELDSYYREIMEMERRDNDRIHEINNDQSIGLTWSELLTTLKLPYQAI